MRRIAGIRGDDLGIEGRVLVGDVGVEKHTRLIAVAEMTCPRQSLPFEAGVSLVD